MSGGVLPSITSRIIPPPIAVIIPITQVPKISSLASTATSTPVIEKAIVPIASKIKIICSDTIFPLLNQLELLLPKLHLEQRVCRLSIVVSPPFDQGTIWSICSSIEGSLAGEAPQSLHLKLSLFNP